MTKAQKLEAIAVRMRDLKGLAQEDPEAAHSKADALLLEALQHLGRDIADAYEEVVAVAPWWS